MKKKSLFLSLCFGGIAILFFAIFAIVSILPPKGDPENPNGGEQIAAAVNEGNNKVSAEDPYYIYDTETFMTLLSTYGGKTKPVRVKVQEEVKVEKKDANGKVILDKDGKPEMEVLKDEDGNTVYKDKLDENNHVVYENDETGATEVYHFKFLKDVDFSGVDFIPLFNKGAEAEVGQEYFIGNIDGNGKIVKNITISINKDNLSNYIYESDEVKNEYSALVAVFGMTKGTAEENATISNISFDNISVNVDDTVISYIAGRGDFFGKGFGSDNNGGYFKEFVVGSIIARAEYTTISANITANINSDCYTLYEDPNKEDDIDERKSVGPNAVGGIAGFAQYLTVKDSKVKVNFISDSGNGGYYLGGVAGYLYNSTISNTQVDANVKAISAVKDEFVFEVKNDKGESIGENINAINIGGLSGLISTSTVDKVTIKLNVTQVEPAADKIPMGEATTINNNLYNKVAGISAFVRADNSSQSTSISNVTVESIVNMDCIFSGAIYEVRSEDKEQENIYVNLKNLVLSSDVDVIMASGVGEMLFHSKLEYDDKCIYGKHNGSDYNVKLTGKTSYKTHNFLQKEKAVTPFVKYYTDDPNTADDNLEYFKWSDIKLVYGNSLEIPIWLLAGFGSCTSI